MIETMPIPRTEIQGGPAADVTQPAISDLPPDGHRFAPATGESDRAFEAFRAYLEMGPQRRYAAVGRKVGASLRTIKRWAGDFDWRGRIKSHAAECAQRYAATANAVQREEMLDVAARAKAFRDHQFALAEALLETAGRFLERMVDDDLDQMNFAGACKALEVAARLGPPAAGPSADDAAMPAHSLRDQLAALLDQAYGDAAAGKRAADAVPAVHPQPSTPNESSSGHR